MILRALSLLLLTSCAGTCPAPASPARAEHFAIAKACVLDAYESRVGPVNAATRERPLRARLAEGADANDFAERCRACPRVSGTRRVSTLRTVSDMPRTRPPPW